MDAEPGLIENQFAPDKALPEVPKDLCSLLQIVSFAYRYLRFSGSFLIVWRLAKLWETKEDYNSTGTFRDLS
jgi:hypothetical protein